MSGSNLHVDLDGLCRAAGFAAWAVLAPVPASMPAEGLDQLLADGVGDMQWLARQRELRLDGRGVFPTARAVLVVLLPYHPQADADHGLRRARYAAGSDYHNLLRAKLANLGKRLCGDAGTPYPCRATADSAPVNERTLARLAGLGWVGRNALLISPQHGSYLFIGTLFTEAPLAARAANNGTDRCGRCTACEQRCPTQALTGRRVLSERCISYLTIEHQGVIPRQLAERFAGWWYGCDLCQEVCPWNRFAPAAGDGRLAPRGDRDHEQALLGLDAQAFDAHFAGSAIRRLGYARLRRNLLCALHSLGRRTDALACLARDRVEGNTLALAQAAELQLSLGHETPS